VQRHLGAQRGEGQGRRGTDSAAAAGDEHFAAGELFAQQALRDGGGELGHFIP
jgi:hypothetical protein